MTFVIDTSCGPDGDRLAITPLSPGDAGELEAMVGRCSAESLYHRFHGVVGSPARAAALLAGAGQEPYLARWGGACVGAASLAEGQDGSAHIGVLVEDRWQRCGVGSALIGTVVDRARERGASSVTADVLFEDRFLLGLLARLGRVRTSASNPGYTARLELAGAG